jgi:outer membrane lipoprotein LolB
MSIVLRRLPLNRVNISGRRGLFCFLLINALVLSTLMGCSSTQPRRQSDANNDHAVWQGRLGVVVEDSPPRQISAGFTLQGTPQAGQLDLSTPLGTTSASLDWTPQWVRWQHDGKTQYFENLSDLLTQALGTDLPIDCVFNWLDGVACDALGWQVDLSRYPQGKIAATRQTPLPHVTLRIQLDQ